MILSLTPLASQGILFFLTDYRISHVLKNYFQSTFRIVWPKQFYGKT